MTLLDPVTSEARRQVIFPRPPLLPLYTQHRSVEHKQNNLNILLQKRVKWRIEDSLSSLVNSNCKPTGQMLDGSLPEKHNIP